jgi:hypothetical protein
MTEETQVPEPDAVADVPALSDAVEFVEPAKADDSDELPHAFAETGATPAIYTLAEARALPLADLPDGEAAPKVYEPPNDRAICAFKDTDGTTKHIGVNCAGQLFKYEA